MLRQQPIPPSLPIITAITLTQPPQTPYITPHLNRGMGPGMGRAGGSESDPAA